MPQKSLSPPGNRIRPGERPPKFVQFERSSKLKSISPDLIGNVRDPNNIRQIITSLTDERRKSSVNRTTDKDSTGRDSLQNLQKRKSVFDDHHYNYNNLDINAHQPSKNNTDGGDLSCASIEKGGSRTNASDFFKNRKANQRLAETTADR